MQNDAHSSYAGRHERAEAFLLARGAQAIDHPGGTLFAHLQRTEARLRAWGARDELALAGLCHATYGTDGFDVALLPRSARPELASVVGDAAEAIVYAYASCDRKATYADLVLGRSCFYDRFAGSSQNLGDAELADFVELTFANELDVLEHSADVRQRVGGKIATLFEALAERAGSGARAAFRSELRDLRST